MEKREPEGLLASQIPHLWLTNLDLQKQTAAIDHFKKQHGAINLEMKRATFYHGDFVPLGQKEGAFGVIFTILTNAFIRPIIAQSPISLPSFAT